MYCASGYFLSTVEIDSDICNSTSAMFQVIWYRRPVFPSFESHFSGVVSAGKDNAVSKFYSDFPKIAGNRF